MAKVLVLNDSYIAIKTTNIYTAIGKLYCGVVTAISVKNGKMTEYNFDEWEQLSCKNDWDENQEFFYMTNGRIAIPRVIRSLKYGKIPKVNFRPSRKAIYSRDSHTCYICGHEYGEGQLTLDHVIPHSKGGKNTWENLATCCKTCNSDKGDKLLSELKWKPKFMPFRPVVSNMSVLKNNIGKESHPEWEYFGI
jgi:hypothetical protein